MITRYLETVNAGGSTLLIKVDSIRTVRCVGDLAEIDGVLMRTPYAELKALLAKDDRRFVIDEGVDFRVRRLARENVYLLAKEFGDEAAIAYINAVTNAITEDDVWEAQKELHKSRP